MSFPNLAGAGLRAPHFRSVLDEQPDIGWFEVHPENFLGAGGPPHYWLSAIREHYPLSMHSVGLSLGGPVRPDQGQLRRLREFSERYQPALISEHLAWSVIDGLFLDDLLPLPYDEATLARVADHVAEVQAFFGRQILIENPATCLRFEQDCIAETEYLAELASATGCGLLLDVNNVEVSAHNHGFDPEIYLEAFPFAAVREIHVAGHLFDDAVCIDSHDRPVAATTWQLLELALRRTGPVPVLVEWDQALPDWPVLAAEVRQAAEILARYRRDTELARAG